MRHALALALIGLSIPCSGCALVQDSCVNVATRIKAPFEEHREKARNRQWANEAWRQVCATVAPGRSEDYASGFKDGFAEFLYRGGNGEPPLVAPMHYHDSRYQNAQGYQLVQDWFAGYRHGATMARDSGARQWITGPSSLQSQPELPTVYEGPPAQVEPIPLPPPTILPDQASIELDHPTVETMPLPAPVRVRIVRITEEGKSPRGPVIINGIPPEDARIRITGIKTAAQKD